MAHLQYMPGDPRLVDQLVYELKSKGIFDQFRKDCIADVDTKPAYQNLRQRVENSVSTFLSRQCWQPDISKNQLREKLRKHILDGNYLEQGVERIVDQVVNPKVASVFIPKVEDLVYNYLGISRKKSTVAETSNGPKTEDLLPNDLEAVSPGSVNNDEKEVPMEVDGVPQETDMKIDDEKSKIDIKDDTIQTINEKEKFDDCPPDTSVITFKESDTFVIDIENIPFPPEKIVVENIPLPENSPPKVELEKIELPNETSLNIPLPEEILENIPLPDEISDKNNKDHFFKPINTDDDDDSSSDSSLRRNMSPLTPIRNYNNENSYDAQQAFENDSLDTKNEDDTKEPSSFRFTIETKSPEKSSDVGKVEKTDTEANLSYQFNNQVNINHFNTPLYEDSSNSHNLQIDYESDANSKVNLEAKAMEVEHNSEDSRKDKKPDEKRNSHKSSHRSRDSHKHSSSSRDKRVDSKQSSSRDSSRHDKSKSSKDEKSKTNDKEKPKEKNDKKDSKDSSRHRSSHKSSHKDSKSYRSSSSSHRHSTKHDDKKSSSSSSQKEKSSDKEKKESSKEKSRDRSSSHRSDKDRKSSSSNSSKNKHEEKDKDKKSKKETDDHYSLSGRGNPNRRSTDRDSNDGSSSSKGSNNPASSKSSQTKTDTKRSSKLDTTSTSGDSTSPSDKENISYEIGTQARDLLKHKPIVRIEKNLETPVSSPPRLPFVPEIVIRKPKIAENFEEAKKIMKMRKFLEEEQRRMNQEAALLLEFQANVRPSLSQVYSNVSGPELEFACIKNVNENKDGNQENLQNDMIQPVVVQEMPKYIQRSVEIETDTSKVSENRQHMNTPVNIVKELQEDSKSEQKETNEKRRTEYFEVTIITEELSENEDIQNDENIKQDAKPDCIDEIKHIDSDTSGLEELKYFGEHEKYDAELERAKYSEFFKNISQNELNNKMYLINCDTYAENIFREVTKEFGDFNIVNYHRNGHLKINKPTTVKNLSTEVSIPVDNYEDSESSKSPIDVFSPQKSDCSFELSSDYNAKLEEMVNKTSRQEIMEIILGGVSDSSNMPKIDYFTESNIDLIDDRKRKYDEEYSMNNNEHVLSPNKLRKLSSDHISSTTKESEEQTDNNVLNNTRSKYLGRPGRVGLPKPRRSLLPNSPSSDKSVENYEQNTQTGQTVNGKYKPRNKVQRYDTSDLYKPKLHYLKRNNIT